MKKIEGKKIEYLDSLRGIACLCVMISHSIQLFTPYPLYVSGCGKIGVWFFLISTGFLALLPYGQDRDREFHLLKYYKRKVLRLYPAYIFVLLISYGMGFFDSVKQLGMHLLFLEGKGHFWYMPVVIKLYLVMPVFIMLRRRIRNSGVYGFVLTVILIVLSIIFPYQQYQENSVSVWWYLPVCVLGMILSCVYQKLTKMKFQTSFADVMICIMSIFIILLTPFVRKLLWGIEPSGWLQNKYLLIGLIWFVIISCCEISTFTKRFLENNKLLKEIGRYSYELYLLHFVIFASVTVWNLSFVIKIIFAWIFCIVFAVCINNLLDISNFCKRNK